MVSMTYKDTVSYYYGTLLDYAREDSKYVFETISIILAGDITYNDVSDLMSMWEGRRRAIVEELRTIEQ